MIDLKKDLVLQSRWQIEDIGGAPHLLYYGLRNPPRHREQLVRVSQDLARMLAEKDVFPAGMSVEQKVFDEIVMLHEQEVMVDPCMCRRAKTRETMQVCTKCVNNDYVLPGLEFDDEGVCAFCQCYAMAGEAEHSAFSTVSEQEVLDAAKANKSRYDAMVLYTGGKDSSYILWLLARKLKLRVLAAFWDMPYCTPASRENMNRAKRCLHEVEFVEWSLPLDEVRNAMRAKWHVHGWPCLCPTAAFPLFYPMASNLRIPYVFFGLEDVQAAVLDYVASSPSEKPDTVPSRRDQTLAFLSVRAFPREQKKPVRWSDEMSNYHAAVNQTMPDLFSGLADLVANAKKDSSVFVPHIGRLSTNRSYGDWSVVKDLLARELDWRQPDDQESLLHTSCAIECVKDYLQFQRFRAMRTVFLPQSMVETGAAVFFGMISRDEGLKTVDELGFWRPPAILDRLASDLGIDPDTVLCDDGELRYSMEEWARTRSGPGGIA